MNATHDLLANLEEQLSQDILAISEHFDRKLQLDERAAEVVEKILEAVTTCFSRYAVVE